MQRIGDLAGRSLSASCAVALLALASTLAGCGDDLTELIVVVDTDFDVPAELDEITLTIEGASGMQYPQSVALDAPGAPSLPLYTYLEPVGDDSATVLVTATGRLGGMDVVERRARAQFVPGESRTLLIMLLRSCAGTDCGAEMTCAAAGCRSIDVPPEELPPWTGSPPDGRRDAGPPDGVDGGGMDGCVPAAETCDGVDEDCDGSVDEDFDLTTDPTNCGTCGTTCGKPANGSSTCESGACALTCDTGWADCDGDVVTGCEADLGTAATCGACSTACAGATPLCDTTMGCVSGCMGATVRCADACVDTTADTSHCGACDNACPSPARASPTCTGGSCGISCDAGFGDCDGMAGNGCEARLNSLTNCGTCGRRCSRANAMATCTTGTCAIGACNAGFDDCDGGDSNGCEQRLDDLAHCGSCGSRCTRANATPTCATRSCRIATCNGGFDDCDGIDGNGCEQMVGGTVYRDADMDGFGDPTMGMTAGCATPMGYVTNNTDCDDSDANRNPGETEVCTGVDDDCDMMVDEGLSNCGDSCMEPHIVRGTTRFMMRSTCGSPDDRLLPCNSSSARPDDVYQIEVTSPTLLDIDIMTGFPPVMFLSDGCGSGTDLQCRRLSSSLNEMVMPGTYYLFVETTFGAMCLSYDLNITYR